MRRSLYILLLMCLWYPAIAQYYGDSTVVGNTFTNIFTDTTLESNELTVPKDSIETWKKLKGFEYASYLDSLLKNEKNKKMEEVARSAKKNQRGKGDYEMAPEESSSSSWLDSVFKSAITRFVLYALAAAFVIFILYKLFMADGGFKRPTRKAPVSQPEVVEEDLNAESDFDKLIRQALNAGNYRLAVRYQYLNVLQQLANRNMVELAADKTNYQYVRELGSGASSSGYQLQNDFASLTLNYEYVWYGEFAVDNVIYNRIENNFKSFNQKIRPL